MIIICIMATAMIEFRKLFADKKALRAVLNTVSAAIILITVIGRLLSGVHWFTDIIAGVLLSSALVMLYYSSVIYIDEKQKEKEGSVAEEQADIVK
jgi:undecaprenyl-diphosphatase